MRISDWSSDVFSSGSNEHAGLQQLLGRDRQLASPRIATREQRCDAVRQRPDMEAHHQCRRTLVLGKPAGEQIGRASCRERVWQYVSISVVAVSLNKKQNVNYIFGIMKNEQTITK